MGKKAEADPKLHISNLNKCIPGRLRSKSSVCYSLCAGGIVRRVEMAQKQLTDSSRFHARARRGTRIEIEETTRNDETVTGKYVHILNQWQRHKQRSCLFSGARIFAPQVGMPPDDAYPSGALQHLRDDSADPECKWDWRPSDDRDHSNRTRA